MACKRSGVRLPLPPQRKGQSNVRVGLFFIAEVAQLVEHQLPKLRVAGSSPVFRSLIKRVLQRCETLFFLKHGFLFIV